MNHPQRGKKDFKHKMSARKNLKRESLLKKEQQDFKAKKRTRKPQEGVSHLRLGPPDSKHKMNARKKLRRGNHL